MKSQKILTLFLILSSTVWSAEQRGVYKSSAPHEMIILEKGPPSLVTRLQLINRAKSTINLEYYIYAMDTSGRLIMNALIKKAKQGIKVRVLIDNLSFPFSGALASELAAKGIALKRYNNIKLYKSPRKFQYRNHRKLLSIDGVEAIVGGRNIDDTYFMIAKNNNKYDRDVYIKGELVKTMDETFNLYWQHKLSTFPKLKKVYPVSKINAALALLSENKNDQKILEKFKQLATISDATNPRYICENSIFATDLPGTGKSGNLLAPYLYDLFANAQDQLLIDNSYFATQRSEKKLFGPLLEKGVDIKILTNGLNEKGSFFTNSMMQTRFAWYTKRGMQVFLFHGEEIADEPVLTERPYKGTFSTHAKSFVIDHSTSIITSYNLDPRSKYYNRELAVVCHDHTQMANTLTKNIKKRMQGSFKLKKNGRLSKEDKKKIDWFIRIKAKIANPIARLFGRLI